MRLDYRLSVASSTSAPTIVVNPFTLSHFVTTASLLTVSFMPVALSFGGNHDRATQSDSFAVARSAPPGLRGSWLYQSDGGFRYARTEAYTRRREVHPP